VLARRVVPRADVLIGCVLRVLDTVEVWAGPAWFARDSDYRPASEEASALNAADRYGLAGGVTVGALESISHEAGV